MTWAAKEAYLAKLRDPRWQKMRLQVLERDEWTCRRCFDSQSTLHVHHRWYTSGHDPWEYPMAALVTLCVSCHEEEGILTTDYSHDLVLMLKRRGAMGYAFAGLCNAFSPDDAVQLDEYDWCVLAHAIGALLTDHSIVGGGDWSRAIADYQAHCALLAKQRKGDA